MNSNNQKLLFLQSKTLSKDSEAFFNTVTLSISSEIELDDLWSDSIDKKVGKNKRRKRVSYASTGGA